MASHVAKQYLDDINDFKRDIKQRQITYIYQQTCQFITELGIDATKTHPDPDKITQWRNGHFGYNTLTFDHQRTFTVATVINALTLFNNQENDE
jgi:hypothetical protein